MFVEFNAWLYQGYDDARAALLGVITTKLEEIAKERKTGLQKAREFLGRARWFRLRKLIAIPTASIAVGIPPVGLAGELSELVKDVREGDLDPQKLEDVGGKFAALGRAVLKPEGGVSPPKEIEGLL